jgi:hypothetical protein
MEDVMIVLAVTLAVKKEQAGEFEKAIKTLHG